MLNPKMPVETVAAILEAEVRKMTPEEREALVKNVIRLKELAKKLVTEEEEQSILNYHAKHVGC